MICIIYYFIHKLLLRCNYVDLLFVDWDAKTKLFMNSARNVAHYMNAFLTFLMFDNLLRSCNKRNTTIRDEWNSYNSSRESKKKITTISKYTVCSLLICLYFGNCQLFFKKWMWQFREKLPWIFDSFYLMHMKA